MKIMCTIVFKTHDKAYVSYTFNCDVLPSLEMLTGMLSRSFECDSEESKLEADDIEEFLLITAVGQHVHFFDINAALVWPSVFFGGLFEDCGNVLGFKKREVKKLEWPELRYHELLSKHIVRCVI